MKFPYMDIVLIQIGQFHGKGLVNIVIQFWDFLVHVENSIFLCIILLFIQHNGAFGMYSGLKNPLTLMSYVTPVMAISTGLLSLVLDPWHEFNKTSYFNNSWHVARSCLLMFFGGTLAFFMVQAFPFLFFLNLSFIFSREGGGELCFNCINYLKIEN